MSSELVRRESWAEPEPGSQPELAPEPEAELDLEPQPSPSRRAVDSAVDGDGEGGEDPVEPLESLEDAEAADTAEVAEEARLLRLRCPSAATAIAAVRESEDEAKRRREAAALTEAVAGEGGISIAQVAAKYGMPRSTLQDRVRRYRHLQQQLAGADDEPAQTQDVQTPPQAPQTRPKTTPQRATATPAQRTHRTPRKPAKISPGSASKRRSEARPASWPEVAALISRRLSIPIELAESIDRAIVSILAGWGTDERAAATIGRTPDWIRQQTGRYKREPSRFQWRKRLSGAPECYEPAFDAPTEDNESYSEDTDSDDSGGGPWHGFPLEVKFACEADAPPDGGLARLPLLPMPVRVRRTDVVRRPMPVLQGPLDRLSRGDAAAAARTVESGSRQPDSPSVEAADRLPVGPPVLRPGSPPAGRLDTPPVTSRSADLADSSPDETLDDRALASPSVDTSEGVPATVDSDLQDEPTPVRTQETVTRSSDDSGVDHPAERAPSPPCAAETLPSDGPVKTSDGASLSRDGASLSHPPAVSPRAESPERAVSPLERAVSPAFSAGSTASSAESILRIVESLPLSDRSPSPAESLTHARSPSRHAESPRRHSRSPSSAHDGESPAASPVRVGRSPKRAESPPVPAERTAQSDEKTKSDDDSAPKPAESPVKPVQSPTKNAESQQSAENQSQSTDRPSQPARSPRASPDREATPPPPNASDAAAAAAAETESPASTTTGARSDRERSTDSTRRRRRGSEHSSHRRDRSDDSDHRSQDRKKKKKKKHHSSDGEEGSRRRSKDRKKKKKKRRSSSHDKEKKGRSRRDKHRSKEEDDVDKLILKTKRRESARLAEEKQRSKEEEVDELILKTKRRESARLAEERLVREAEKLLQAKAAAPASTRSLRSSRSGSGGAVEPPASDAVEGATGREKTPEKVKDVGASEEATGSESPRASDADGGEPSPTEEPTPGAGLKDGTGADAGETATATVTQEDQKLPADDAAAGTSTGAAEAETTASKQDETPTDVETTKVTKESLAAARASASASEVTDTKQEDLFTEASAGDAGTSSSPGDADAVKPQDEALYAWLLGHMGSKKAAEKFGVGRMMVRARRDAMTKEQRVEFVKKMKKHYERKGVAAAKPAPERPPVQSAAPARPAKPKPSFGEALMLPETTLSPRRRRGVASGSEGTPARKDRGERKSGRGDESPSAPAGGGEKDDPAERPPRLTRTAVRRILHRLAECPEDGVDTRTALEAQLALPPAGVTRLVTMVRQRRHSPMAVFSVYCRLWREAGEAAASPSKRQPDPRSAADTGGGGDGSTAAGDRSTAGEDGLTASGDAKAARRDAKQASDDGQTMHEDVKTDVGDSNTPSRDATTPGTPGETGARAQRHRRPPKRLEGYLDVHHVASATPAPAPAPAPATSDLCARAEAAARAASAVERGLCPSGDAAARYGVTPEELAEASRTLHNMPQIKMKLKTLGMRRAVAAVLRGRSQQWAVSTCKVSAMTLWKTLKKLREAGLIGQHIGKRRFIGGEADPAPSVSAADAAADTAEDSERAPPADGAGDRRTQRLSAADTADDHWEPPATPADEDTGADTDWVSSKPRSDHSPSRGRGRGSRGQSSKVREAMAAINSGQMTKVAAAKKFGISQNYIYKIYSRLKKKSKAVASETATASSDPRVERIRAALAEATQSSESRASIAKKYGINYFTFHYYWKRHQEGKPLMAGSKSRPPAPAAAASPASVSVSEPDSPAPPPVDPESISEAMRKAIGAVILGKMCIKASSSLHRVPFVQLKALCQSMTARYDSKGAVVVESAEQPAPSRQQPALTSAVPSPAAVATSDVASGTPKKLKVMVKSEPATPVAAAGGTEPMTAKQHRRALTGLRPQMAAAVRDVLAGSPAEQAAEAHGVSAGKLRLVLRCRGLAAPAVSKLTLTRTAAGYQVNRAAVAAAAAAAAAAADGLNLREAAERVILLGEQAAAVASALSLDVTLLERHCTRRPAPEPHFHAVRDEIPVLYAALALCEQGYDINVDSLRWMFAEFLTKSGQSTPPEGEEWLSLDSLYARWPELRGQISTETGAPTEAFCAAFTTALNTVCDELELKLGELVLHDAESARRRRTREVLPLPVAAAPPAGHIWDNRNGSWILEKDGKQQAFFEVETILARRDPQTAGGQPEYLIRWKGYTDSWNTWEPEGNLECTDTLAAFQRRWDSVPDEERRRIIEQLSPISSAPAAAVTTAAGAAAGAAGTPARAAGPAGKKGTPASLSRKGRPPKTSQQTLDGMAAARKAKTTPSAGQLRVRTDLGVGGVGDSASPAPASASATPVSTSDSTPAPSQAQRQASTETATPQQQGETPTPAPAGEETRGRRSTKARANALFKQWLVSPKQATRQAVQESLADVPGGVTGDGPPPPPPVSAVPTTPSPSTPGGSGVRPRPNLSVSRVLSSGSGGSGGGQRRLDEFVVRGSGGGAKLGGRASSDAPPLASPPAPASRTQDSPVRPGPPVPPPAQPAAEESIESETERLRKLDEELRLLDAEEAAAAGTSSGETPPPPDDETEPTDATETASLAAADETDPETASPRRDRAERRRRSQGDSETVVGAEEQATPKAADARRASRDIMETRRRSSDDFEALTPKKTAPEPVADARESRRKSKRLGDDAETTDEIIGKRRISRASESERGITKEAEHERRPSKEVDGERNASQEAKNERRISKEVEKKRKSSEEAKGKVTTEEASEDNRKTVKEAGSSASAAMTEAVATGSVAVEAGQKTAPTPTQNPVVVVVRRGRGRPPKSPEKRAALEARLASEAAALSAGGTPTTVVIQPPRRSVPLDDDAPLSKRRRTSEGGEPAPAPTPTPDSAVGKRQRKVPKRFLDGETLLWGETPLPSVPDRPTADAAIAAARPAAAARSAPPPARLPPADGDSPRPITFEPPNKRKPIVFVSPIRKEGGIPIAPRPTPAGASAVRRLDLDGPQRSHPHKIIVRTITKTVGRPATKPAPPPPQQQQQPQHAPMQMMILDDSADVVIEDGPVIIDESGQLVSVRSMAAPVTLATPARPAATLLPPPPPPPAAATTPVASDAPVKKRRGRPPKIPRPDDGYSPAGQSPAPSPAAPKPTSTPKSTTTTTTTTASGKTPLPGKKRGRKPKPRPEPEPEPAAPVEEMEEPEEVTLDLSSLVNTSAGADLDADVGYFDVNGQFVERCSPMKGSGGGGDWGAGGAHYGLDGVAADDTTGMLDGSLVLVHGDSELGGLSIGGEAI